MNPRKDVGGFITCAEDYWEGFGIFVLVKTSNPGSADVQDAPLADGRRVWELVAEHVERWGREVPSFGAVVGATYPGELAAARRLLPRAPFLLPGVGAQGGRIEDLAPAFAPGRAGGLVAASRAIVYAHERVGGEPGSAAGRHTGGALNVGRDR